MSAGKISVCSAVQCFPHHVPNPDISRLVIAVHRIKESHQTCSHLSDHEMISNGGSTGKLACPGGKFERYASGRDTSTRPTITTLTRLAISHDRQLQTLEDRHTVIALIYGQQEKAKVRGIRDEWQRQKPDKEALHPSGASQRSVIWSQILVILQKHHRELITKAATDGLPAVRYEELRVQQGAPGFDIAFEALSQCSEAINRLAALPIPEVEKVVFRLWPKHPNPRDDDDKPWVWTLVLAQSASSQTIRDVETAASHAAKPSAIKLQPQLSQDGPSCKTACCTHERQRQGQGERKKQSTLRQPRPRRRTKQQQEETERRLVGLSRRLAATKHDGVLFNQCYFMPFLDKQSHEVCCEGPPPSGPLRGRWRCEVASALSGAPRKLLTEAVRGTHNNWVSSGARNFTSFPGMVSLWPTYPPTPSTTYSGLRLKSIPFCPRKIL